MAWSYSGDPTNSNIDAVRFEIQDVFTQAQLVQDGEIVYALVAEGGPPVTGTPITAPYTQPNILSASAKCCEALVRRFSMQADTEIGSLKLNYSKMAAGFAARAAELRAKAQGMQAPWSGGQSISEKSAYRANTDQVQPVFESGQFDNPYAGPQSGYLQNDPLGPPIAD